MGSGPLRRRPEGVVDRHLRDRLAAGVLHRDRDAEFRFISSDADVLARQLDHAADLVREVLETLTTDVLDQKRECRGRQLTVRSILLRVLAHTALHVGHTQVTRQLWEIQHPAKKAAAAE